MNLRTEPFIKGLTFILFYLTFSECKAQSTPSINFDNIFPIINNPALYGSAHQTRAALIVRKQWVKIEGAPESAVLLLDKPLNYELSWGLSTYYDKQALLQNTSFLTGLSYRMRLTRKQYISFGLSIGASYHKLNIDELSDAYLSDNAIQNRQNNTIWMDGQFGMAFESDHFTIGISMPQLLQKGVNYTSTMGGISLVDNKAISLYSSYKITTRMSPYYFTPIVQGYYDTILPWYIETTMLLGHEQIGEIAAGYKSGYGITGYLNLKLNSEIMLGYAYDYPVAYDESMYIGGSHEIMISIRTGKERKQMYRGHKFGKRSKFRYVAGRKSNPTTTARPSQKPTSNHPQQKEVKKAQEHKVPIRNKYEQRINEEAIVVDIETKPDIVVKKGGHPMELPKGNYVVIGEFNLDQEAKNYMDDVKKDGFAAQFGYASDRKKYYVYLYTSKEKYDALWEVQRLQQIGVFKYINYLLVE